MDKQESIYQQARYVHSTGNLYQAEMLYRHLLSERPQFAPAMHMLGLLCHQSGRQDEALQWLHAAAAAAPHDARIQADLAAMLGQTGCLNESLRILRALLARSPEPLTHNNIAITLDKLGDSREALEHFRAAVALAPTNADYQSNLGEAMRRSGRLSEALSHGSVAVELNPQCAEHRRRLALALAEVGQLKQAVAHLQEAVDLAPQNASIHSNLVFMMHYCADISPEALHREARQWAIRHAARFYPAQTSFQNSPNSGRVLRIGYISADFREHTRMRFVEPVLAHHDRGVFEVICYSDTAIPDSITGRIRSLPVIWRDTANWSDEHLARQIRLDQIDILVELTGHMGNHRLLVFARKPAPIQIAWPGYPATTAVETIDALITDADRDPPGAEVRYTERLCRLDITSQCYRPTDEDLSVGPLPSLTMGRLTFASLNKLCKINEAVVSCWARILKAVPDSRLILLANQAASAYLDDLFSRDGVEADRLELIDRVPRRDYLAIHNTIDINLDPWPYNGHTTLLDGVWMGVPPVVLEGATHASREGVALLHLLGLPELAARTVDDYVQIAVALAGDVPRLAALRNTLRPRIQLSPLRDEKGLARRLEATYRQLWEEWCRRESTPTS